MTHKKSAHFALITAIFILFAIPVFAIPLKPFTGQSIEDVKKFIVDNNIVNLEQFLPTLSISVRSNFILMRQSRSLQPTDDPLQPRVLLFGDSARVVFAFNGVADSIEMMEKPIGSDQFIFSRLNFDGKNPPTEQKTCMGCHQGRPLWGQYRHWNGMYGGDQDLVPQNSLEEIDYLKFAKSSQLSALYKNLIFKCVDSYEGGIKPGFINQSLSGVPCVTVGDLLKDYTSVERIERRIQEPGEAMGELLNRLNADRLFVMIKKSPHYKKLSRIYVGNSIGCYGERVFDLGPEQDTILDVRKKLSAESQSVFKVVADLLTTNPSPELTLQGQMLNLLGVNVPRDIRMDFVTPKRVYLGNDCDKNSHYSPGAYCGTSTQGYVAYSDGYDMATNLIGYLILRDIYKSDSKIQTFLAAELEKLRHYFASLPPDSGEGYYSIKDQLKYLSAVIEHLNSQSVEPSDIPKAIQDYPFIQLLKLGKGFELCQMLAVP